MNGNEITLGELTSVITKGTTPTTLGKKFTEEGINFLKVQSIDADGNIINEKLTKIDEDTHELLKRSQLQNGDILFSIAGAIGRTTIINQNSLVKWVVIEIVKYLLNFCNLLFGFILKNKLKK